MFTSIYYYSENLIFHPLEVTKILVLTNGTLIDGTRYEPIQEATVVIKSDHIEYVGSETRYPKDTNVINLQDLTIIPGLIDCHLHLSISLNYEDYYDILLPVILNCIHNKWH